MLTCHTFDSSDNYSTAFRGWQVVSGVRPISLQNAQIIGVQVCFCVLHHFLEQLLCVGNAAGYQVSFVFITCEVDFRYDTASEFFQIGSETTDRSASDL